MCLFLYLQQVTQDDLVTQLGMCQFQVQVSGCNSCVCLCVLSISLTVHLWLPMIKMFYQQRIKNDDFMCVSLGRQWRQDWRWRGKRRMLSWERETHCSYAWPSPTPSMTPFRASMTRWVMTYMCFRSSKL